MEKTIEGKLGNFELGLLFSLVIVIFGLAFEIGKKSDDYNLSVTLGLGPISLNVTWLKSTQ
jgi:hypothetical protein